MDKLINELCEILEVDELDLSKKFTDYDEWDSLASLSILALLDSDYNMAMTSKELTSFANIEEFCKKVIK